MTTPIEFRDVGKTFPGVVALDGVGFRVAAGEVRALIGENGAGKSTLLKVLGGQYRPDAGTLLVDGAPVRFAGPADSQVAGIAIIHQELQLFPDLSVAENLMMGVLPAHGGFVDRRGLRSRARDVLARLGEPIDPDTRLGDLTIGRRQMVEIGRALLRDARVIAFDEPTSSLSARETERLKAIIADLRDEGRAIIYVSHRMEEVYALADTATVLRDGRSVLDASGITAADADRLIAAMAGRDVGDLYNYRSRTRGQVALGIHGVEGPGVRAPVTFDVAQGEIVGMFGLVGAGRSELFRLLYGAVPRTSGQVVVDGVAVSSSPRDAIAAGLALCPEDRKDEGIVALASVRENVALAWRNRRGGRVALERARERADADAAGARMRIKAPSPAVPIASLSGGNQQKAVIARWLMAGASILLLDEPTRGIDVGARSEIYDHLHAFAEGGGAVLFASSDLPEVLGIADRIVIMREGEVAAILSRGDATAEDVLRLALPLTPTPFHADDEERSAA